jgi:hypothetical protein
MSDKRVFLSVTAGVVIPALQAVGFGLAGTLTAGALALLLGAKEAGFGWMLAGGTLGLAGGWVVGILWWRAQLEAREREEQEQYQQVVHRIEMARPDHRQIQIAQLSPVNPGKFLEFAREMAAGGSTSEAIWVAPRRFQRREFARLREDLIRRKLGYWKSEDTARGWALTGAGRAVMRYFAGLEQTPPPLEDE